MKIEKHIQDDHQARLTVEIEPDILEASKRRAARKLANRIRIPGFRPGKAPYAVIVRTLGDGAILEEALELLVDEVYPEVLSEADIYSYGPGNLEKVVSMDPLVLEFLVPLKATVTLGEYGSLRKPYEVPLVSDEQVNDTLHTLRERQAIVEPVDRPAQEGDIVTIRLSAIREVSEEDKDPVLIRERSVPILLKPTESDAEERHSPEWPFPGFSRHLVGLKIGDQKSLHYSYAQEDGYDALAGVEADFALTVEEIKSRTLPDLTDDFASTVGEYANMQALQNKIRLVLQEQITQEYNDSYDEDILEETRKLSTIVYPPQMLEREADEVIDNLKDRLGQQNQDIEMYLKSRGMTMEELHQEALPAAKARLEKTLLLMELVKAENITITPDELQHQAESTVSMLAITLPQKDVRRLSEENVYRRLMSNIMADMLLKRAMDHLRDVFSDHLAKPAGSDDKQEELPFTQTADDVEEVTVETPGSDGEQQSVSQNIEAGDLSGGTQHD